MFGIDLNKVAGNVFGGGTRKSSAPAEDEETVEVAEQRDEESPAPAPAPTSPTPASPTPASPTPASPTPAVEKDDESNGKNDGKVRNEEEAPKSPKKKRASKKKKSSDKKAADKDKDDEAASPKSPKKKRMSKKKSTVKSEGDDAAGAAEAEASPKKKKAAKKKSVKKQVVVDPEPEANNDNDDHHGNEAEEMEDDISKMLADLEFPDFSMSDDNFSAGGGGEEDDGRDVDEKPAGNTTIAPWDKMDWNAILQREEVFSKRYKPSKDERQELSTMANHLGLAPSTGIVGMGLRMSMQIGMGTQVTDNSHTLFYGGHSILLKRGPVQWNDTVNETTHSDCGLLLLTDGFVLTYRAFNRLNLLEKRYETCQIWKNVDFCEKINANTFAIQLQSGTRYELEAVPDGDKVGIWMQALERVLCHHVMHNRSSIMPGTSSAPPRSQTLGWQYQLIRTPGYTAAVTGDLKAMGKPTKPTLNTLDHYNEFAPLHYAVQQDECDPKVIQALLQLGADPNIPDGDERSAMYYVERNGLADIKTILEGGGGKASKLAEMEMRGELFGGIDSAHQNTEKRRERDRVVKENEQTIKDQKAAEANAKAETANSEMGKAMSALVERGEKIQQMDDKTKDLQAEAKTFGDLASQLKDQVKGRKWYQL